MNPIKKSLLLLGTILPSNLRIALLRSLGHRVGQGVRISPLSILIADEMDLGAGVTIEPLTLIYSPKKFIMGERSRIAGFVRIIGFGEIVLGPQSFVGLGNLIDTTGGFYVGERSHIGPRGTYYSHGSTGLLFNVRFPHRVGPIRIGSDCWMGMNCVVYPNVKVGDESIVFSGLTLSQSVPAQNAVLPPEHPHRLVSVDWIRGRVDNGVQLEHMEKALHKYAGHHPGSQIDHGDEQTWVLSNGTTRIVLLRTAGAKIPTDLPAKSVIWTLDSVERPSHRPLFDFHRLKTYGEWTPFADSVARFLCDWDGVHFVFASTESAPPVMAKPETGDEIG